ncbi:chromate transporter [Propylenella binzhouense]|uniref:Chromate transporter n=1 Tax=Propylenella binzhouense TaxID=2555902 RepID=A0A964T7P9_9HYPH|nr:chromate transporter [Propylenella binzhouense]
MSREDSELWTIAFTFSYLSMLAVGGVNALVPEMHRLSVDVYGWMTSTRFTDLFAIAQASPGPNMMIVTLIGWQVAGVPGAVLATACMTLPTSVAAFLVATTWDRFREAKWRIATQSGLVPVAIGLFSASAFVLARHADETLVAFLITIATAALVYYTKVHPLLLLGAGGAIGAMGLL